MRRAACARRARASCSRARTGRTPCVRSAPTAHTPMRPTTWTRACPAPCARTLSARCASARAGRTPSARVSAPGRGRPLGVGEGQAGAGGGGRRPPWKPRPKGPPFTASFRGLRVGNTSNLLPGRSYSTPTQFPGLSSPMAARPGLDERQISNLEVATVAQHSAGHV